MYQTQPPSLTAAQASQCSSAGRVGIEAQAMQHSIDSGGDGIAAFPLESLQVPVVSGEHLGSGVVTGLSQRGRLIGERALQRQQSGEAPGRGLPYGFGAGKLTVLLHQREAKTRAPG